MSIEQGAEVNQGVKTLANTISREEENDENADKRMPCILATEKGRISNPVSIILFLIADYDITT